MVDPKCHMEGCNALGSLGHLLNHCNMMLDRYKYRHDSVLNHIVKTVVEEKSQNTEVYADLQGWRVNGGTVPANMVLTDQMPDIVLVDRSNTPVKVVLLELTCSWDSKHHFQAAMDRKEYRYRRLTQELKDAGYNAINLPLEIGARGVINSRNVGVITTLGSTVGIRNIKKLRRTLGKICLLGSYRIWLARRSQEWSPGDYIQS